MKLEYTPMSIISAVFAAAVKAAAKTNPSTAPVADGLGAVASAIFGGNELEKEEGIKEKLNQAMDEAWEDVLERISSQKNVCWS